ncbi:conserved hypothetical protein [Verticillium alfalfae VaMs.102]|uniref:Prolyl 4-hydroxylase alpha subunit domain-containing protein n=1 Tax=Verticillium alfalfae (strain VaMs.102 / ATCC MYA-4576 / FGSC 10136) TaxID=526221 RepID=C9SLM9_VERA1|nr:conserved hypothetical protein [Verticillium alfalfae VaMs.102]EEY19597.1 conserved hypothetical protein [Verticillium alfalfae VaMs.102]
MVLFCRLRTAIAILGFNAVIKAQNREQAPLVTAVDNSTCEQPSYRVHIFSTSPLVIYLTDFISPSERQKLQSLASSVPTRLLSPLLSTPTVTPHTTPFEPPSQQPCRLRSLSTASTSVPLPSKVSTLPLLHALSPCSSFAIVPAATITSTPTGSRRHLRLRLRRAAIGPRAFSPMSQLARVQSEAALRFPCLRRRAEGTWCRWVDCDAERDKGAVFRPIEGSAVFWENLGKDGAGDVRTLHAGEPVVMGSKIGMNIWTRQAALGDDIRSGKP